LVPPQEPLPHKGVLLFKITTLGIPKKLPCSKKQPWASQKKTALFKITTLGIPKKSYPIQKTTLGIPKEATLFEKMTLGIQKKATLSPKRKWASEKIFPCHKKKHPFCETGPEECFLDTQSRVGECFVGAYVIL
jgi:hypothetical protein